MKRISRMRYGRTINGALILLALALPLALIPDTAELRWVRPAQALGEDFVIYFPGVFGKSAQVYIPAGSFWMGCDPAHNGGLPCDFDELPLHSVYMSPYYIDRSEVTNARYEACVAEEACTPPSDFSSSHRPEYYGNPEYADFPVIYVDWYQAQAFCEWAGGSLPTEAEWEKAARGGSDTRAFPWGDAGVTCELANARVDGVACSGDTTQGGRFSPEGDSPYGVYDMAGNVYEWVKDWYSPTYYEDSPASDPPGPASGTAHLRRSGAFGSWPNFLRVAVRVPTSPATSRGYIGFRCAYSP